MSCKKTDQATEYKCDPECTLNCLYESMDRIVEMFDDLDAEGEEIQKVIDEAYELRSEISQHLRWIDVKLSCWDKENERRLGLGDMDE